MVSSKIFGIIALLALVSLMIAPVMAVTETGNFSTSSLNQYLGTNVGFADGIDYFDNTKCANMSTNQIAAVNGVNFVLIQHTAIGTAYLTNDGTVSSASTRFTSIYGNGQIGYQFLYNLAGSRTGDQVYVYFDNPISTSDTGPKIFSLNYNVADLHGLDFAASISGGLSSASNGSQYLLSFSGNTAGGLNKVYVTADTNPTNYYQKLYNNINRIFKSSYEVTLDEESNIVHGSLTKSEGGISYASKGVIYDTSNNIVASESSVNTNKFEFISTAYPILLKTYDAYGQWHNSSILLNLGKIYTLSVSPETGTVSTNFTASSSSGAATIGTDLNQFTLICSKNGGTGICTSNNTDPVFIKKGDGYWYQDQIKLSTTFPSTIPLTFGDPGQYTVTGYYFPSDITIPGSQASDTVNVSSTSGDTKLTIEVRDAATNAFIQGSTPTIRIKKEDGTWINQTVGLGSRDFWVKRGSLIGYGATASGYVDSQMVYSRIYEDAKKVILLSRATSLPAGNNTLNVYVYSGGSSNIIGLEGAMVHLNDGQTKSTPGSGLASFIVLDNATYTITVSKTGYESATVSYTPAGVLNAVSVELRPLYITTPRTLAPGETATPTAIPTVDTRTNDQKGRDIVNLIYDNGETIVIFCIALFFIGGLKMMTKK